MSSGKVHSAVTVFASGALFLAMTRYGFPMSETTAISLGCLSGVVLTPDLDVDNGSISHSVVDKYFGVIVGFVWRVVTKPYAVFVPHRSPMSHFPVLGTFIRIAYFGSLMFFVKLIFNINVNIPKWELLVLAFYGLVISDTLHVLFDVFGKSSKKSSVNSIYD